MLGWLNGKTKLSNAMSVSACCIADNLLFKSKLCFYIDFEIFIVFPFCFFWYIDCWAFGTYGLWRMRKEDTKSNLKNRWQEFIFMYFLYAFHLSYSDFKGIECWIRVCVSMTDVMRQGGPTSQVLHVISLFVITFSLL